MRKLLVALGGLFICLSVQAQSGTGTVTTSNADCTVVAACAADKLGSDPGSVTIQVTGTWSATLQFEASSDSGTTFVAFSCTPLGSSTAVTSATANGTWRCNAASITDVRVRASAMASGTAAISFRSSRAVANAIGGGGTSLPALSDNGTIISSTESINLASGTAVSWNSDTGLSRESAAIVDVGNGTAGNAAGSLRFTNATMFGKDTIYNNKTTAGFGVTAIYGATSQKAETTTADANVLTYTPTAAVGTYRVNVAISVSSATSGVISYTVTYKDSNGNTQTAIVGPLFQHGTASPNTTFTTSAAGNYSGSMLIDVDNSATAIVVKWVGGGTTAAKMSAAIEQLQ